MEQNMQKEIDELLTRLATKMNTTKTEVIRKGIKLLDLAALQLEKQIKEEEK